VVKGPIVSEVHVYMHLVTHIVRLYNSSGMVFRLLVCLYFGNIYNNESWASVPEVNEVFFA